MSKVIGVTGATGQLGRLVISSLLNKTDAANVVALVRNPDNAQDLRDIGVQVRQADYNQPDSLASALVGINKLLLISGSEVGQRAQQHQAVIDAAKEANVELLAYTSLLRATESPLILAEEHKITEAAIELAGLPAVILRNGWYTENYTQTIGGALEAGIVAGAAEQGVLNTASRKDYAEAAAVVLTSSENHIGKIYELAGDQGFTLEQYAAEIAKQSGKQIAYQNMTGPDFKQLLVQIGLPEGLATILEDAEIHAAKGWLSDNSSTLSQLIGRPTTLLTDSVTQAL